MLAGDLMDSEPSRGLLKGAIRNLTIGCLVIFGSCGYLALFGFSSRINVFVPLVGLLTGMFILLGAVQNLLVESLVAQRQRGLASRLRLFTMLAAILAVASLVAAIIRDQLLFPS